MRGADLEPTRVLLDYLRRRIAGIGRQLGAYAQDDERFWWAAADLAELGPAIDVLIDRDRFPTS
jgi:hypothetical protein